MNEPQQALVGERVAEVCDDLGEAGTQPEFGGDVVGEGVGIEGVELGPHLGVAGRLLVKLGLALGEPIGDLGLCFGFGIGATLGLEADRLNLSAEGVAKDAGAVAAFEGRSMFGFDLFGFELGAVCQLP